MTNATLQTYKKIIGFPFAGSEAGDGVYDIRQDGAYPTPSATVQAATVSLARGFDAAYDVPVINGGSILDTKVLNSVLSLVSRDAAYRQAGGIYTFEQELSDIIGGYPEGAILQYLDANGTLHYLRSLVDNNTSNFVRDGIDSTKWAFCLPAETSRNLPTVDWGSNNAVRSKLAEINIYTTQRDSTSTGTYYTLASGTFNSSGYVHTVVTSNPVAGPDYDQIPNGVRVRHEFLMCVGGNDAGDITSASPDQIISGSVSGAVFQILNASVYKDATSLRRYWYSNGLFPVNAGTSWALKYICQSDSMSFSGYIHSSALLNGQIDIFLQALR